MISAATLSTIARRHLGRFHRHRLTAHHDHELVRTGPYHFVRHPIYAATVLAFAGIGATLGNGASLVVLIVLPTAALIRRIGVEGAMLVERLGSEYEGFRRARARLLRYLW